MTPSVFEQEPQVEEFGRERAASGNGAHAVVESDPVGYAEESRPDRDRAEGNDTRSGPEPM